MTGENFFFWRFPALGLTFILLLIYYFFTPKKHLKVLQVIGLVLITIYGIYVYLFFIDLLLVIGLTLMYQLPRRILCFPSRNFLLSNIERLIYERDFKEFMTEEIFYEFIEIGNKKAITSNTEVLALEDTSFDKLYYFAVIPKYEKVLLKSEDTIFSYIKEGSWIGIVEFILNYLNNNESKWLINLSCESTSDVIIVYEFDKNKLIDFLKNGKTIMQNGLFFIWIKYLIISVSKINIHLAEAYKAIEYKPATRLKKNQSEINEYITMLQQEMQAEEVGGGGGRREKGKEGKEIREMIDLVDDNGVVKGENECNVEKTEDFSRSPLKIYKDFFSEATEPLLFLPHNNVK